MAMIKRTHTEVDTYTAAADAAFHTKTGVFKYLSLRIIQSC